MLAISVSFAVIRFNLELDAFYVFLPCVFVLTVSALVLNFSTSLDFNIVLISLYVDKGACIRDDKRMNHNGTERKKKKHLDAKDKIKRENNLKNKQKNLQHSKSQNFGNY